MKKRHGFVSNSSSSSFLCLVCGHQESGYDMCYSEYELAQCENGHEFCDYHIITPKYDIVYNAYKEEMLSLKRRLTEFDENKEWRSIESLTDLYESTKEIFDEFSEIEKDSEECTKYLESLSDSAFDDRYDVASYLCPICTMESIQDEDILTFLSETKGINLSDIRRDMKDQYKIYDNFSNRKK